MKFYTIRPESFAIYKRTEEDGPWLPYQYYSSSCWKTYGKDPKAFIRPGDDERIALCTDEFSDIAPLSGGNVAFSTLEGRPSAYNFDRSPVLQVRPHFVTVYIEGMMEDSKKSWNFCYSWIHFLQSFFLTVSRASCDSAWISSMVVNLSYRASHLKTTLYFHAIIGFWGFLGPCSYILWL